MQQPSTAFLSVCERGISSFSVLKYFLGNEKQEVLGCSKNPTDVLKSKDICSNSSPNLTRNRLIAVCFSIMMVGVYSVIG